MPGGNSKFKGNDGKIYDLPHLLFKVIFSRGVVSQIIIP